MEKLYSNFDNFSPEEVEQAAKITKLDIESLKDYELAMIIAHPALREIAGIISASLRYSVAADPFLFTSGVRIAYGHLANAFGARGQSLPPEGLHDYYIESVMEANIRAQANAEAGSSPESFSMLRDLSLIGNLYGTAPEFYKSGVTFASRILRQPKRLFEAWLDPSHDLTTLYNRQHLPGGADPTLVYNAFAIMSGYALGAVLLLNLKDAATLREIDEDN